MRQYQYPKVPNHYQESVTDEFLEDTQVCLIEKLDGSNCKFAVYDQEYESCYGDEIHSYNPSHGDIFVSSKTAVRGRLSDHLSNFDGAFHRLIRSLRETISSEEILELHDYFDAPLVFYGEHMIRVTLDYDYETNPPPAFIGFDILQMPEYDEPPANPLEQRFTGFLDYDKMISVYDTLGIETARLVDVVNTREITQSGKALDIEIPESEYADTQAEGVVLRSDEQTRRVKYVAPEFRERSEKSWSALEDNCETGAEMFCARYITNARIRKTVMKAVNDPHTDQIAPDEITETVIADAWSEELDNITTLRHELRPTDIYDIAYERCETVTDIMKTNAQLNETDMDNVWTDFAKDGDIDTPHKVMSQPQNVLDEIEESEADETEIAIITTLLSEQDILQTATEIADREGKEMGNWVIPAVHEQLHRELWHENIDVFANLSLGYTPSKIGDELMSMVAETITTQ